ncbi:MAG: hypothetical protein GF372_09515 [Candidatus Marinimicrobia bacterium]|nr:hypothetical protein [Candidatus Neomarinimicrobiota bacterium]
MKEDFYFDFRDIFRIPRIALSGKKIWTLLLANLFGYAFFIIFAYLGIAASGFNLGQAMGTFHLFPFPYELGLTTPGWVLYFIGGGIWVLSYYFANMAVARITYKELKGDFFYSSGDGFRFMKKHWHPLIFAPLAVVGIIVFLLFMAVIAGLLGKIPILGEFIFSLPFLLYFPVSIFVLYTAVVFILVITFTPAIVATSEEDTLEAVFQGYSLIWTQPWRLVTYEVIWAALVSISWYIFGLVMAAGVWFISFVFGQPWLMGDKLSRMLEASIYYLGGDSIIYTQFIALFSSPFMTSGYLYFGNIELTIAEAIASGFLGLGIFFIMAIVVSYATTLDSVGQTIIYLILRKKKDNENLLERKDEDEIEEEEELDLDTEDELEFDSDVEDHDNHLDEDDNIPPR